MSLNGDVMVIRNGRSTSTISIYNYPEHLNPFYEDDQHKRLRFWPVSKRGLEGRRNSFSLSGLKDMWAFKSFLTKKKSSTLGINKTSESPPTLRREYQMDINNLFNSYDRRARYSSNDGDKFQRNTTYRSSLQNMNSTLDSPGGFGLNRNDQYRSTIQFGGRTKQTLPMPQPRRYVYGGSVTPQPPRSSEFCRGYSRDTLTHGSSQTSISTNPFDTDYYDEDDGIESPTSAAASGGKEISRKKRRAPAPPTPKSTHSSNLNRFSPESSQTSQPELRIEEDIKDIANLTAEIESFVKTKTHEMPEGETKEKVAKENTPKRESLKTNGTIPKVKPILKTSPNQVITREFRPATRDTDLHINEQRNMEKPALPEKKKINQKPIRENNEKLGTVECIHIHVESPRSTQEREITNIVSSFKKEPSTIETITANTSFTLASPPNNRREITPNGVIKQQVTVTETVTVVKKEEEPKGAVERNQASIEENKNTTIKPPISAKPEAKARANKSFAVIYKPGPTLRDSIQNSEAEKTPVPSQKVVLETITMNEVHAPKETSEKLASVLSIAPVPEVRKKTLEKKGEINAKTINKIISVPLDPEKSYDEKKFNPLPAMINNSPSYAEPGAQSLPTSVLEIIEPDETSLRIEETPSSSCSSAISPKQRKALLSESREEFEALYRNRPSAYTEWKHSTLAPLETPVPPEKRRSVKDIIESINRSQRLLQAAANKDLPELITTRSVPPPSYSEVVHEQRGSNDLGQTIKSLNKTAQGIENMIASSNSAMGPSHSNTTGTPDTQKPNNEEIFKKCRVNKEVYDYRETSPTASNLDWNPVPKPKRSRNIAEQREH